MFKAVTKAFLLGICEYMVVLLSKYQSLEGKRKDINCCLDLTCTEVKL